jgi:hypothetical protein
MLKECAKLVKKKSIKILNYLIQNKSKKWLKSNKNGF